MQVIEKAEGNPDQVEVETSQLIFKVFSRNHTDLRYFSIMCPIRLLSVPFIFCASKSLTQVKHRKVSPKYTKLYHRLQGIFTSGEELVMTVVPILDFLPEVSNIFSLRYLSAEYPSTNPTEISWHNTTQARIIWRNVPLLSGHTCFILTNGKTQIETDIVVYKS